jgi:DNA transposition AAA+ family ATPase
MGAMVFQENVRTPQQDLAFAFLDEVYLRGPMIGALIADHGMGKTTAAKMYKTECEVRHWARLESRRVIVRQDVLRRFRGAGFKTSEDLRWFDRRCPIEGGRRYSEAEVIDLIRDRMEEKDLPAERLPKVPLELDRPCPHPTIITPSQTTTPAGLIKLVAREVTGIHGLILSTEELRFRTLSKMRDRGAGHYVIIDEAQRLGPATLPVSREFFDDAGVSVSLLGTPDLLKNLHRGDAKSLLSRISIIEELRPLTEEQVATFLDGWDRRLARRVYAHTGGVFRRLEHLLQVSDQIRENNGERVVSEEILNEAVLLIPDLLPDTSGIRGITISKGASVAPGRRSAQAAIVEALPAVTQATG